MQTSYDQNIQLILKSYLPVMYGTALNYILCYFDIAKNHGFFSEYINAKLNKYFNYRKKELFVFDLF
jgi:hypothetical protein